MIQPFIAALINCRFVHGQFLYSIFFTEIYSLIINVFFNTLKVVYSKHELFILSVPFIFQKQNNLNINLIAVFFVKHLHAEVDTKFGGTKPKWLISKMTCNTSNRYATSSRNNSFVSRHRIGLFQSNIFIGGGKAI